MAMNPSTMTPDQVFQIANLLALPAWLALAASPSRARWAGAARLFAGRVVPLLLAAAYVALFASQGMGDGGYGSLAEVQRLMTNPWLLTAGWLHYLAFDLFVGSWISEQAAALALPHWLLLPPLALTFLFGPAGLLVFFGLRTVWRKRLPAPAIA